MEKGREAGEAPLLMGGGGQREGALHWWLEEEEVVAVQGVFTSPAPKGEQGCGDLVNTPSLF